MRSKGVGLPSSVLRLQESGVLNGVTTTSHSPCGALCRRRDIAYEIDLRPDWYRPEALCDDVVLVLRGRKRYRPVGSQINLLWLISHPNSVSDEELEAFDHVFVASQSYADILRERLSVPVSQLLQCSAPEVFYPPQSPNEKFEHDVLFVGNSRDELRSVVADAIANKLPLSIFGSGWDTLLPTGWTAGPHIPNSTLHAHYRGAKIVLNDHWSDMEREGFVSNRIFDVALSGGFVISRDFKGSDLFGNDLVTYRNAEELAELCRKWRDQNSQRSALAESLRQRVLASHTFSHRAADIANVIELLHNDRSAAPDDAPSVAAADGRKLFLRD